VECSCSNGSPMRWPRVITSTLCCAGAPPITTDVQADSPCRADLRRGGDPSGASQWRPRSIRNRVCGGAWYGHRRRRSHRSGGAWRRVCGPRNTGADRFREDELRAPRVGCGSLRPDKSDPLDGSRFDTAPSELETAQSDDSLGQAAATRRNSDHPLAVRQTHRRRKFVRIRRDQRTRRSGTGACSTRLRCAYRAADARARVVRQIREGAAADGRSDGRSSRFSAAVFSRYLLLGEYRALEVRVSPRGHRAFERRNGRESAGICRTRYGAGG
jgi:hypothetical protein